MEKEQSNLTSTGLIINGAVWVKYLNVLKRQNKSHTISFGILKAVLLWKTIWLGVQSHPEDWCDVEQGSTVHISECNNQLELELSMCCSYTCMVFTNPCNFLFRDCYISAWRTGHPYLTFSDISLFYTTSELKLMVVMMLTIIRRGYTSNKFQKKKSSI